MCGRFALQSEFTELPGEFSKHASLNPPPRLNENSNKQQENLSCKSYNIPPTRMCPVFNSTDNQIYYMRWGLIPSWSSEPVKFSTFNARLESLETSYTWKKPKLKKQYCLVPMHGYFEWRKTDKQPFFVKRKDGKLLFVAGLFEISKNNENYSFTIITSPAPKNMEWLHGRLPAILEPGSKSWDNWLRDGKLANALFDDSIYEYFPVTRKVGSVKVDSSNLVSKIEETELTVQNSSKLSPKKKGKQKAAEGCKDILHMFGRKRKLDDHMSSSNDIKRVKLEDDNGK